MGPHLPTALPEARPAAVAAVVGLAAAVAAVAVPALAGALDKPAALPATGAPAAEAHLTSLAFSYCLPLLEPNGIMHRGDFFQTMSLKSADQVIRLNAPILSLITANQLSSFIRYPPSNKCLTGQQTALLHYM
jgi:hypothetical protein